MHHQFHLFCSWLEHFLYHLNVLWFLFPLKKKFIPFLLLAKTPFLYFPQLQNSQVNLQLFFSYLKLISSTLAWKIPWMEEPGRLQSVGSLRVGHDWATSLSFFTSMHWRRKWQSTPVFLPGESQGRGSMVGCRLWVAQSRTLLKWLSSSSSKLISVSLQIPGPYQRCAYQSLL